METKKFQKNCIKKILCLCSILLIVISVFTKVSFAEEESESIIFSDENLYEKICEELEDIIIEKDDGNCAITVLSSDIEELASLNLNNSNITDIDGIEAFINLEELNISNNNITNISSISSLTNLVNLQAYGNTIADITPISNLTNLEILSIAKNKLDDSSADEDSATTLGLNQLINLVELDISHNYLSYTNGLETLTSLTSLDLYDNAIHNLDGLETLTNLEILKLGENNESNSVDIENLEVLNNLINLKYFEFSENATSDILEKITSLTNLETLNLEANNITDISCISNFTNLKVISLYNNSITDISPLLKLTNLEEVILQENSITSLEGILNSDNELIWENLDKLDIFSNSIADNDILEILCEMSNNGTIELNYEDITDTSLLPHYDSDGTAYVTYEDFGARCDGEYDDFIAIRNAHTYANEYGYEVRATEGKTYHIFKFYEDAVTVKTSVDWNNANFVIHDEEIEEVSGRFNPIFQVTNITDIKTISNPSWTIDTDTTNIYEYISTQLTTLNSKGYTKYLCIATNSNKKQYIRYGSNANSGNSQEDCFLIDSDGNVLNDIQWDFEQITSFKIYPLPDTELNISNGNFTSNSLNSQSETTYTRSNSGKSIYFQRNIYIVNSANINVSGINHTISNDEMSGSYYGFLRLIKCAEVSISDCSLYTRKYSITGRSTYDLNLSECVNTVCKNIISNDISDTNRWGIVATYFSKDIVFDSCTLNRIDAHQGIYNLTISNCEIGIKGLTMTGQGTLNVVNTTITSDVFITLRTDYGSTWNGDVNIIDCTYVYTGSYAPKLFSFKTSIDDDGTVHDFGYDCKFPNVYIENIIIDLQNSQNYNFACIVNNSSSQNSSYTLASYWPDEIYINGYEFINAKDDETASIRLFMSNIGLSDMTGNYVVTNTRLALTDSSGTDITSKFDFNEEVITNSVVYLEINTNNSATNVLSIYKDEETLVENMTIGEIYNYSFTEEGTYTIQIDSTENIYSKTGTKIYEFTVDSTEPTIDIEVTKNWDDDSNSLGIRPSEATVVLSATVDEESYDITELTEAEVILTETGSWTHTWENLPKYTETGQEIEYSIQETSTFEEYYLSSITSDTTVDGEITYTVTNSKYGSITLTKVDKTDTSTKLGGATFKLEKLLEENEKYVVDESFEAITLTTVSDTENENFGTLTFENLEYGTYKITETKAPEGYNLSTDTLTVTVNSDNVETSVIATDKKKTSLPITGENGIFYVIITGMLLLIIGIKTGKNKACKV